MERDLNPPEDKVVFEPDVDSINDEIWLRKKEEEDKLVIDELPDIGIDCISPSNYDDKCFEKGEEK